MKKCLILCLLPFLACQKESENPNRLDERLLPLAVGNYWIYDYKSFNPDGSPDQESSDTSVVIGPGSRADYFLVNGGFGQLYSSDTEVKAYAPDEDVDWIIYRKTDHIDTFNIAHDSYGEKNIFIAYPETHQVSGYTCIKVERLIYLTDGTLFDQFIDYLSPGIGIIRSEHYARYDESEQDSHMFLRWQSDLVSYKIDN